MPKKSSSGSVVPMRVSVEGDPPVLRIEFDGDATLFAEFEKAWQKRPGAALRAFRQFVISQARRATPPVRNRTGTFNPQIPSAIYDQFKHMCDTAKPPITQIEAIKMVLNRYIDTAEGRRRTFRDQNRHPVLDRYGQRRYRAPLREEFADPAFAASPTTKMQIDLGPKLKAVVEDLIADIGVGKSLFFVFVLAVATSKLERHAEHDRQTPISPGEPRGDLVEPIA
jgi:hypothetical protein